MTLNQTASTSADYVDTGAGYATDTGTAGFSDASTGYVQAQRTDTQHLDTSTSSGYTDATRSDEDNLRVQVHEEELQAEKVQREAGAVRVSKDVVEEEQTLEVPVTREEVHVQSRVVDRPVTDSTTAFTEDVIEVPVREEDVQVRKEARVAEELEIEKRAVQETERVTDTVRKERVNVEESGDVDVTALAGDPYNRNITARD